jgi:hypothetical protein
MKLSFSRIRLNSSAKAVLLLAFLSTFLPDEQFASASPFSFSPSATVVGDITREGYFLHSRQLGKLILNQNRVPVYLVFTTDPKLEPSILGNFWYLPLFRSKLWFVDAKTIFWRGIDGKGTIFKTVGSSLVEGSTQAYKSKCGRWLVEVESDRRMTVTHPDLGFRFLYSNGDLRSFSLGDNSPIYSIAIESRSGELSLREGSKRVFSVKKIGISGYEIEMNIQGSRVNLDIETIRREPLSNACAPEELSVLTRIQLSELNLEFNYDRLKGNLFSMSEYTGSRKEKKV